MAPPTPEAAAKAREAKLEEELYELGLMAMTASRDVRRSKITDFRKLGTDISTSVHDISSLCGELTMVDELRYGARQRVHALDPALADPD